MSSAHPIQVLVNYWELSPPQMGSRLDELLAAGVQNLATFVPWQAVESDISHTLVRFLQAVTERKMTLSLIVTPEVGVHYAYSGLPRDIIQRTDSMAQTLAKNPFTLQLPPNSLSLPSLLAPEFTKRYYSFLSRVDHVLADFEKSQPSGRKLSHLTVVLTGSFWKYYRTAGASAMEPFGGKAGDYSPNAAIGFRQRLEDFYSQAEFNDPNAMASNRWKTQSMEEVNRRWFYQQSEAVFRNRTIQFARKKCETLQLRESELFTPEADPSLAYSHFLQAVSGQGSDFFRLSRLVDEAALYGSMAGYSTASPYIHWSALGGFRDLTDSEKQFLILKSLLLMGGQENGGVLVDDAAWMALSKNFRARAEAIGRALMQGELRLKTRALYLAPHLWSGPCAVWREFVRRVGPGVKKVASIDYVQREKDAQLLFVDPSVIITRELLHRLLQWASSGRTLVLPKSPLYTESARAQLDTISSANKRIEMNLGISYRIHPLGDGKLVIYDAPEASIREEMKGAEWQNFLVSVLSLAEVQAPCQVSDSRIAMIPLERRDGSQGLFVMNGSRRTVSADLLFPNNVHVSDLAVEVAASKGVTVSRDERSRVAPAKRFTLDVPPCAVLPLLVDRVGFTASRAEQTAADHLSNLGDENVRSAAQSQFPGLEESNAWN